jgi:type I restriction enzyme S subunit
MSGETLATYAEIIMGQSPASEFCNTNGEGLPLLNGPTEYGPHHPTPVQFTTDVRKTACAGDILFCVRGSTTGRMNWADQEYAIGRGVAAIRHKNGKEYQAFVRAVIEFGLSDLLMQATGSTFPNVSGQQLASLWCPTLDLPEQRVIAHILGTLDDGIELNRQMGATLEAMARAIFKEGLHQDSREHRLDDLCEIFDGPHATPRTVAQGPVFLGISNLLDGLLDLSDTRHVTEDDFVRWTKRVTPTSGDVVFSYETRLGQAARIPKGLRCCLGRRMGLLRAKEEKISPVTLLYAY